MKAYIAVSYSKRQMLTPAINAIVDTLKAFDMDPLVFVDNFQFDPLQEQQMMQRAMLEIANADLFIAETSDKAIGIGVEAGYAKASDKPVIYMRQQQADHSTTISGISDFQIIYKDADDLKDQLTETLTNIKRAKQ
jgi:nucleoside 2-deoxyribosyltransferase